MIYICEDFLSKEQCDQLVKFYKSNINDTFQYRDTFPLSLLNLSNDLMDEINSKVESICKKMFSDQKIKIDNYEIVKWPEGSFQDAHYDGDDVCAVIIYLNDDFVGGKTCFNVYDTIKITPETGKCVIFSNSKHLHWVEKIFSGFRYTLAYWFVKD